MWRIGIVVTLYVLAVALIAPALLFAADDQPVQSNQTAPPEATPSAQEPPSAAAPTTPAQITTTPPTPSSSAPAKVEPRTREAKPRAVARAAAAATIADFAFSPKTITVTAGETVTWRNDDSVQHSATADNGSFDTGLIAGGASGSHTFDTPGTYAFHCTPHPNMTGTVRVLAASTGGGGSGSSGGGSEEGTGSSSESSSGAGAGSASGSSGGSGSSSGGSGLAATGLEVALLALLGIGLLCCGAGLRRLQS